MYYFSSEFVDGLETKSLGFQKEFYGIVDAVCSYLDEEEEKIKFQKFIENNHFFGKPGNILYDSKSIFGGIYRDNEYEALKEKIHNYLLGLFDDYGAAEAMVEVPHIIVCISAPEECFNDDDVSFVKNIFSFERICRGYSPVYVTVIVNDTSNGRGNSCLVAAIK